MIPDIKGIGNPKIEEAFTKHLPAGTVLLPAPVDAYLGFVLKQPIIQEQLRIGIYHLDTIQYELVSVAWSWSNPRMVAVCLDLVRWHMRDVPLMFAYGFAQATAIHEAHHVEHHLTPCDLDEQIRREVECNEALEANHPQISALADQAMELSPTIRRVMDRSRLIGGQHGR